MRYYNLKVLGLIIAFVVFIGALAAHLHAVAVPAGIVGALLFVSVLSAQGAINRANSAMIKTHYDAFIEALTAAQTAAARDLQGADSATVEAVTAKLMEAGQYRGSNPAWRNTRRIITATDIANWYDEGKVAAEAASALISAYKNSRQS